MKPRILLIHTGGTLGMAPAGEPVSLMPGPSLARILEQVPEGRQTYLFSATLPAPIAGLAKRFLKDPFKIQLGESDELVTLALPSGWSYEVVDDVDCLSPGQTVVKSVVAAAGARGVDGGEQAREY